MIALLQYELKRTNERFKGKECEVALLRAQLKGITNSQLTGSQLTGSQLTSSQVQGRRIGPDAKQELKQLKSEVSKRNTQLEALNKSARLKRERLAGLERSIVDREAAFKQRQQEWEKQLEDLQEKVVAIDREFTSKQNEVMLLQSVLTIQEESSKQLQTKHAELDVRVIGSHKILQEEAVKLRDLEHSVETERAKRDSLKTQIATLKHTAQDLDAHVSQLHAELAHAEQLREEQLRMEQPQHSRQLDKIIVPERPSRLAAEISQQKKILKHLRLCVEQCREELLRHKPTCSVIGFGKATNGAVSNSAASNSAVSNSAVSNSAISVEDFILPEKGSVQEETVPKKAGPPRPATDSDPEAGPAETASCMSEPHPGRARLSSDGRIERGRTHSCV
ncbi:hypothetical protein GNI_162610 [Gregarina niphandrodes]|uniref:Uncharacterized protein n=1 Tax=Gregarina niphandrodes TaxID=110365 RepID=A0A023AYE0_GRENI|nr:hypothetical protein GNI_162610 [Gregarina niphandrodes]EZG43676.1 hypothetical protein GNI_162610 [Gregarina niphandrodes]|eukprot:XP_011133083.1 hypothetical protein GNI_162610 [Gregarina niphandrodes]